MKKFFVPFIVATLIISCKKENPAQETISKTQTVQQKNEMVGLMDKMMSEMHNGNATGNDDKDFAVMMAAHHRGAVEMSELLLQKGKDPDLKRFGKKVISAQKTEIEMMDGIPNGAVSEDAKDFQKSLHQSMSAMMDKNIPVHNDIDKDYAQQMIAHHQSAVDMAKVYLKTGKNPQLVSLCSNIIKTQTAEIAQLKNWLKNH